MLTESIEAPPFFQDLSLVFWAASRSLAALFWPGSFFWNLLEVLLHFFSFSVSFWNSSAFTH